MPFLARACPPIHMAPRSGMRVRTDDTLTPVTRLAEPRAWNVPFHTPVLGDDGHTDVACGPHRPCTHCIIALRHVPAYGKPRQVFGCPGHAFSHAPSIAVGHGASPRATLLARLASCPRHQACRPAMTRAPFWTLCVAEAAARAAGGSAGAGPSTSSAGARMNSGIEHMTFSL